MTLTNEQNNAFWRHNDVTCRSSVQRRRDVTSRNDTATTAAAAAAAHGSVTSFTSSRDHTVTWYLPQYVLLIIIIP